jgi:DNA-binding MarR family transcriptional regulator
MGEDVAESDLDRFFVGRLLFGRALGALGAAYDRALVDLGLTFHQLTALINCVRGEANTPVKLAALNGVDVSTMSRMVDRLEAKGLLARDRSRKDRRQVNLRITAKGHAALREALPVAQRLALEAWRGVTNQERRALRNLVGKIVQNLSQTQGKS